MVSINSTQPRKQRKFVRDAPLHLRKVFISSALSDSLRKQFGKRSFPLRKGDEVEVMRGSAKGKKGKITKVSLKKLKVFVDSIKIRKSNGIETEYPISPSNLRITKLELEDKMRQKALSRKENDKKVPSEKISADKKKKEIKKKSE